MLLLRLCLVLHLVVLPPPHKQILVDLLRIQYVLLKGARGVRALDSYLILQFSVLFLKGLYELLILLSG